MEGIWAQIELGKSAGQVTLTWGDYPDYLGGPSVTARVLKSRRGGRRREEEAVDTEEGEERHCPVFEDGENSHKPGTAGSPERR